jgi:hypothetical protein
MLIVYIINCVSFVCFCSAKPNTFQTHGFVTFGIFKIITVQVDWLFNASFTRNE